MAVREVTSRVSDLNVVQVKVVAKQRIAIMKAEIIFHLIKASLNW